MGCKAIEFMDSIEEATKASGLNDTQIEALKAPLRVVASHMEDKSFGPSLNTRIAPLLVSLSEKREDKAYPVSKVINSFLHSNSSSERKIAEVVHTLYLREKLAPEHLRETLEEAIENNPSPFLLKALLTVDAEKSLDLPLSNEDLYPLLKAILKQKPRSEADLERTAEQVIEAIEELSERGIHFTKEQVCSLLIASSNSKQSSEIFKSILKYSPTMSGAHFVRVFSTLLKKYLAKLDERSYEQLLDFAKCVKLSSDEELFLDPMLKKGLESHPNLSRELQELDFPIA